MRVIFFTKYMNRIWIIHHLLWVIYLLLQPEI
jgi:hypothetical protein